jgi:hypothetical protein
MFEGLSPEQVTGLVTGGVTILLAFLEGVRRLFKRLKEIREELGYNTSKTVDAELAARSVHKAQVEQAELDFLRRHKAAFDAVATPEWHEKIDGLLAQRRLRASDSELVKKVEALYERSKATDKVDS